MTIIDPGYGGVALLMTGKIDADMGLANANPYIINPQLEAEGRPPVKFVLNRENGVPNYYYQLFVANETWAKENPATVCRFLRATTRGHEAFHADPEPVLEEIAEKNEIFTLELHRVLLGGIKADWHDTKGRLWIQDRNVWKTAQAWALKQGLISDGSVDPATYFTNEYLPN